MQTNQCSSLRQGGFGMVLISRRVDYAILALHDLMMSQNGACARELADRYGLSRPFIANILKQLCQEGFIDGTRGVNGGYRLAKPPAEIRIQNIIESLDGPFQLMACAGEEATDCELTNVCPIRGPLKLVHQRMIAALADMTLEDLAGDEPMFVAIHEEKTNHDLAANLS